MGFTLLELMLVVAILGIIASMGSVLLIQTSRFYRQNQARLDIQRDARTVFNLLAKNLRQAQASTITIDNAPSQPPYSRITFTKMSGDIITYYQENNKLYQVTTGTRALCETLRYVGFSMPRSDDDNLLSLSLTLEKATYEGGTKALQLSVEKIRIHND